MPTFISQVRELDTTSGTLPKGAGVYKLRNINNEGKKEPNLEPFLANLPVKMPKMSWEGKTCSELFGASCSPPPSSEGACPSAQLGRHREGEEKPELVSSKPRWGLRWEEEFQGRAELKNCPHPWQLHCPMKGRKGGIIHHQHAKDSVQNPAL